MDKKGLIALILCGLIMLYFFNTMQPPSQHPDEEGAEKVAEETIEEEIATGVEEQKIKKVKKVKKVKKAVQEDIELQDYILIQNDVMKTVWTNEGAALKSVILPEFRNPERTQVLELLKPSRTDSLPLSTKLTEEGRYQLKTRRYKVVESGSDKVVFATLLENGIQITKDISLQSGKYYFDVAITLQNTTDSEILASYSITVANGLYPEIDKITGLASIAGIDVGKGKTKLAHTDVKDMPYKNESVGITMAGATNKYFAAVLKPSVNNRIAAVTSESVKNPDPFYEDDFTVDLHAKRMTILPQGERRHDYAFFLGPKNNKALTQCDGLLAISDYDFGMTRSICKVLVKILNMFYGAIPNYGVSILLLTFLVKLVLFPLTRKSQMSMFRMQQLQPLIAKLKEKHKGDKQKVGQEQMKLFKQHGVNPMSGCFPILLQL
ncbi:MAG: membrane protein insertase YidC, partial [Candidatus Scalindua sp.]|nr:membrane protein insertase YidC [Candidatus Scalindua sp.]